MNVSVTSWVTTLAGPPLPAEPLSYHRPKLVGQLGRVQRVQALGVGFGGGRRGGVNRGEDGGADGPRARTRLTPNWIGGLVHEANRLICLDVAEDFFLSIRPNNAEDVDTGSFSDAEV